MKRGHASATALLVALSVWRHGARFGLPAGAVAAAGSALEAAGGGWRLLRRLAASGFGSRLLDAMESLLLPGLAAHHCRRKRWLWQRLAADAADAAERRWIWLGVGFDALGRALAVSSPQAEVLETDHKDSLALRALSMPAASGRCVRTRPLRLPGQAAELLRLCASAPAVLVAEGLLMYLPPRPLLRLLRRLAALPRPPQLWISALASMTPGGAGFARADALSQRWLARQQEPFRWRLDMPRMQSLLRRHGYLCVETWHGDGYGEYLIRASPLGPAGTPVTAL